MLLLTAILFIAAWLFLVINPLLPVALARPLFQAYLLAITAAYFIYCWTHSGQTLPMKTWHIRLVMNDGAAIPVNTALPVRARGNRLVRRRLLVGARRP